MVSCWWSMCMGHVALVVVVVAEMIRLVDRLVGVVVVVVIVFRSLAAAAAAARLVDFVPPPPRNPPRPQEIGQRQTTKDLGKGFVFQQIEIGIRGRNGTATGAAAASIAASTWTTWIVSAPSQQWTRHRTRTRNRKVAFVDFDRDRRAPQAADFLSRGRLRGAGGGIRFRIQIRIRIRIRRESALAQNRGMVVRVVMLSWCSRWRKQRRFVWGHRRKRFPAIAIAICIAFLLVLTVRVKVGVDGHGRGRGHGFGGRCP